MEAFLDTRNDIKTFILENFMLGRNREELEDSVSLLDMGIIDSTGILELVEFVEKSYGVKIEDNELVPENLDSIDNLVTFIGRKTA
jgi:acyl carrier protein